MQSFISPFGEKTLCHVHSVTQYIFPPPVDLPLYYCFLKQFLLSFLTFRIFKRSQLVRKDRVHARCSSLLETAHLPSDHMVHAGLLRACKKHWLVQRWAFLVQLRRFSQSLLNFSKGSQISLVGRIIRFKLWKPEMVVFPKSFWKPVVNEIRVLASKRWNYEC